MNERTRTVLVLAQIKASFTLDGRSRDPSLVFLAYDFEKRLGHDRLPSSFVPVTPDEMFSAYTAKLKAPRPLKAEAPIAMTPEQAAQIYHQRFPRGARLACVN